MTQEVTPSQVEVTQADALAFANEAFRNIDMPRLSNAEMRDIEGALRGFLRRDRARFEEQTRTATEREVVERCAQVAEGLRRMSNDQPFMQGVRYAMKEIASEIRALSEQKS